MAPLVKFCGLTRREDAEEAVRCGASYLGVIFAGGPRLQSPASARVLLHGLGTSTRRVGVFGGQEVKEIAGIAAHVELEVAQLHADPTAEVITALRGVFGGEIWGVLRVRDGTLPSHARELFAAADGVVLDAHVPGTLGGSGTALPWEALAAEVARLRGSARLVLAGGLHPENVGQAIAAIAPDVVDVSSGVERAPGIKDHSRLRDFRDAVRAVEPPVERNGKRS